MADGPCGAVCADSGACGRMVGRWHIMSPVLSLLALGWDCLWARGRYQLLRARICLCDASFLLAAVVAERASEGLRDGGSARAHALAGWLEVRKAPVQTRVAL